MTHEQFIELKTAKLAKQAGFDWKTYPHYQDLYGDKLLEAGLSGNWNYYKDCYSAPTQAVLQRWLREVKNIWVSVTCDCAGDLQYSMYRAELYDEEIGYYYTSYWDDDEKKEYAEEYPTYEAALEAGLQKCLTLLIKKQ